MKEADCKNVSFLLVFANLLDIFVKFVEIDNCVNLWYNIINYKLYYTKSKQFVNISDFLCFFSFYFVIYSERRKSINKIRKQVSKQT